MGFERWTERARQVVVLAQQEARTCKHNFIGTEHVLIGLLAEEEGVAARVLEGMGLTAEMVRQDVERIVGRGEHEADGQQIPFTPRSRKVFEMALREALSLGHNYIGTEHVLLGMVRENEGVGARILLDHDVDSEKVRNEVVRLLSRPAARRAPEPKPVQVAFTVDVGQVWIDDDGTSWYVKLIDGDTAHLERTVTDSRPLRDLVRKSRLMGEAA